MKLAPMIILSLSCGPLSAAVIEVAKNGPIDSIQAGVDAAAAGDVIVVKAGVFDERVVVPVGKDGLRIKAKPGAILDGFDQNGGIALTIASDDVEVSGLTIRNPVTDADPGHGISVSGNRPRIRKCRFLACEFRSIETTGADPTIEDCKFVGSGLGIRISGSGLARVVDCAFELGFDSIQLDGPGSAVIVGCSFTNISGDGVGGDLVGSLDVVDCRFKDISTDCVDVAVGGTITVRKNSVDGTRRAFLVSGALMTLTDNTIRRTFKDSNSAIDVDLGTCDIRKNSIRDSNGTAIRIGPSAIGSVRNNKVQRCGSLGTAGILIDAASDVTVADNVLSRLGGDGIRIALGNGGAIVVDDNTIKDCGRDGIDVGAQATAAVVTNNVVRRCLAEGIENSGANATITDNDAKQSRLDLANDGTATFTANVFTTGGENVAPEID
ncbi:MAG: right-handed parallel beta-helix repeat-containing protein [Planctomycetes bacterium]|nr:right-handed parallel beta-helix repeat-containing protein [Planctomycetota bacterium]MCC7168920.1 right-handed parallel beta-helix repeat-containing protein [Planctomycetota bacterium]